MGRSRRTLPEELLLLALDPTTGTTAQPQSLDLGLAGAQLVGAGAGRTDSPGRGSYRRGGTTANWRSDIGLRVGVAAKARRSECMAAPVDWSWRAASRAHARPVSRRSGAIRSCVHALAGQMRGVLPTTRNSGDWTTETNREIKARLGSTEPYGRRPPDTNEPRRVAATGARRRPPRRHLVPGDTKVLLDGPGSGSDPARTRWSGLRGARRDGRAEAVRRHHTAPQPGPGRTAGRGGRTPGGSPEPATLPRRRCRPDRTTDPWPAPWPLTGPAGEPSRRASPSLPEGARQLSSAPLAGAAGPPRHRSPHRNATSHTGSSGPRGPQSAKYTSRHGPAAAKPEPPSTASTASNAARICGCTTCALVIRVHASRRGRLPPAPPSARKPARSTGRPAAAQARAAASSATGTHACGRAIALHRHLGVIGDVRHLRPRPRTRRRRLLQPSQRRPDPRRQLSPPACAASR
ncbi:hypothetical protein SBADM41S_10095 [Streptomyces badius]